MGSQAETSQGVKPVQDNGGIRGLLDHSVVRYLIVGGCSFLIDLGLLAFCYRIVGMPLWLATAAGFWTSFFFNFFIQRRFSFGGAGRVGASLWRYAALLGANTIITIVAVELSERSGIGFAVGKTLITVAQTIWNYLIYRHWVFAAATDRQHQDTTERHPEN